MMGSINWGLRLRNPVFWAQAACAVVLPLVVGSGLEWSDMTSWPALADAVARGLGNPVVFASMVASLWACVTDPTTTGTGDSADALGRTEVKPNARAAERGE